MLKSLTNKDTKWLVSKLPKKLLKELENTDKPYVIAGGYIRATIAHEKVNDIDVFAASKEDAQALVDALQPCKKSQFVTDNAYSVTVEGRKVQVIHRWTFSTAVGVLMHFDFTIARAAIYKTKDGWASLCDENFYSDLAAKRLVYTNPDDAEPGSSLLRVIKFCQRGYSISLASLAEIVARTADSPVEPIRAKLKEVDPHSFEWSEGQSEDLEDTVLDKLVEVTA